MLFSILIRSIKDSNLLKPWEREEGTKLNPLMKDIKVFYNSFIHELGEKGVFTRLDNDEGPGPSKCKKSK